MISTGIGVVLLVVGIVLLGFGLHGILTAATSEPSRGPDPFIVRPAYDVPIVNGLGGVVYTLWSLGCLLSGVQFLAMGTLYRLAIHVEENTRISAQCLESIRSRLETGEEIARPIFRS
jgi:hypothetical protein